MRYAPHLKNNPWLRSFVGADAVFLDTTYSNKRHTFPPQDESIGYVVSSLQSLMKTHVPAGRAEEACGKPSFIALIATYGIGKERILQAVAEATGRRLYLEPTKYRLLEQLNVPGDGVLR